MVVFARSRTAPVVFGLLAALVWLPSLTTTASAAETRRAFVVGVQRYNDPRILQLSRTVSDAKDLAADLEQVGFDKKNVVTLVDPKTKAAFDKDFDNFLKTVEAGDIVLFFFSGHGFGVEADQTNYLLLGDVKSPFAFTQSQISEKERPSADIINLRVPSYIEKYQTTEIPRAGLSASEILDKINARKPKKAVVILDACRSLLATDVADANNPKIVRRGPDSGSRLLEMREPPRGFLVMLSASFGEQAIERFDQDDKRRNSLFTEVLRSELQRPGQSLVELAKRVRMMVRAIAEKKARNGQQQEPEFVQNGAEPDDFFFIPSIGRERFELTQDKCEGSTQDWEQINKRRDRDMLDRHRRRFDGCATAEKARGILAELSLSSDEPPIVRAADPRRPIDDCDRLAGSDSDPARPPEVPGVSFPMIVADQAIAACNKSYDGNPRVIRFLFNLARAYHKLGLEPSADQAVRNTALRRARANYDDAAKRGYVSALNNLALLYESGQGGDQDEEQGAQLLKRAAQQGHPLAMFNLALHYRDGTGAIQRDVSQAAEWFGRSAESGNVSAMVGLADALFDGRGVTWNPRRAIEWYQRAADSGSSIAKVRLGQAYYRGGYSWASTSNVPRDFGHALLWFNRAVDSGDNVAQYHIAMIMEAGDGLPNPQPEIAERYWRLAAQGGNSSAQVQFAERLKEGFLLIKQENGSREAIGLLERAMAQGSPRAAFDLALIYREGTFGQKPDPVQAMKLAYRTIELAVQAKPTSTDANPFHEIAAGHLLAAMARNGEAVDAGGRPLLTSDEVDRIQRYYGMVDPVSKQVKVRRLQVPMKCYGGQYTLTVPIWVWDWGRMESPTEPQFRAVEQEWGCSDEDVRKTLISVFEQAKKNKVPFADLIEQRIKSAQIADEKRSKR